MTDRKTVRLVGPAQRATALAYLRDAPDGWIVSLKAPTRSLDANAKLWATLADISAQVEWYGRKLTAEDWKHMATAAIKHLDVVPNIAGTGFVALGMHTSNMSVREMNDLIEFLQAFAAERGVVLSGAKA